MSFGRNTPPTKRGRPISAEMLNRAAGNADAANRLRAGPGIAQASIAGIPQLRLAMPGPLYHARTTSGVSARVGATMGHGTFQLYYDSGSGVLVNAGLPDQTGYSISGTSFLTNVWCQVGLVDDEWKFVTADCSGVA